MALNGNQAISMHVEIKIMVTFGGEWLEGDMKEASMCF